MDGKRVWVKLKAATLREAKHEITYPLKKEAPKKELTVGDVLKFYTQSNCPKRDEQPREGRQLTMELRRSEILHQKLSSLPVSKVNHGTLRAYRDWRGHTRACELDITTLACALRWASRNPDETGLTENPMPADRPKFAPVKQHCRERQPKNADQLHEIASNLISSDRSAIFGWMMLFLAFTGIRIGRAMTFRLDAKDHDPGHYDGECIWVGVSQTHKGVFPFIRMHDALSQWLDAFMAWRQSVGINSPWYFPSPKNPTSVVGAQSLEHAMRRVCAKLDIPKCSPHGLRSYFVNVLRSQGVNDSEIALRIGHKSGGRLIVEVYGEILPQPIGFIPEGDTAW